MAKFKLIAVLFYLTISYSSSHRMFLGNESSLRKNIADLLEGKLTFSDANLPFYKEELTDLTPEINSEYDFIVIGAGSAGATIASRLSENDKTKVLLIEAGIKEYPLMDIPLLSAGLQISDQINWMYETESSDKFGLGFTNFRYKWPQAKVMGGNSVLNFMLATRGNKNDFNAWANATGDLSWSYKEMLEYFKKLENYHFKDVPSNEMLHNKNGPLYIEASPYRLKLVQAFVEANEELGLPLNDYNGQEQMGVCYAQSTMRDGERWSVNRAYLHPIKNRTNLFLTRNSHVSKILIDKNTRTANSVEFIKDNKVLTVKARKEIILSAGAINSPQILMLSGIGPAEHLNDLGIDIIKDAPVGKNLMDHVSYGGLLFKINASDTFEDVNILNPNDPSIKTYLQDRNGLLSDPAGIDALSFVNVNSEKLLSDAPNMELLLAVSKGILDPIIAKHVGLSEEYRNKLLAKNVTQSTFMVSPIILDPKSRGEILLRSKSPTAKPKIYPNYLDDPDDLRVLIGGIRAAIKVTKMKALQKYGAELCDISLPCEKFKFDSDAYWECAIRTLLLTSYHPCGTCKMGKETDKSSVVDSKLKVIGLKGLRVADASIMPKIPTAHLHIPVVAIAEKISDEIKREWNISVN